MVGEEEEKPADDNDNPVIASNGIIGVASNGVV